MAASRLQEVFAELAIERSMEVRREEYLDYMTFKRPMRPMFTEIFGPMPGLKQEWAEQGATSEELNFSAFRYRQPMHAGVAVQTGLIGGQAEVLLEETDEHIVARDKYGRRVRLVKGIAGIAMPLEYPVETMDDWLKLKPHYEFSEERFFDGWKEHALKSIEDGYVLYANIPGGFDEPRQLMGEENLCIAYYEQPELVHDILNTIGETAAKVLDRISAEVTIDELFVHEDMAGKSGPLAGPKQIKEFIGPYYRRIWDLLAARGTRVFRQDSDGNMDGVIEAFLDAGLNCMFPMEPAAGMDIVKVREKYGNRLAVMGGIDKHVLRRTKEEIRTELEYKIPPMAATGGAVLGCDHRVTSGTSLENYRYYIETAWEIMDREAAKLGLD